MAYKFSLYIFGKLKHVATYRDKNVLKLGSHIQTGGGGGGGGGRATKYAKQNQVPIFCVIKHIEEFEVTYALTRASLHKYSMDLILLT